jgi:hypothetical protein
MAYQRPDKKNAKPHPADLHEAAEIARAIRFTAHFRKGPFEKYTIEAASLEQAREAAKQLDAEHGKLGRRAVVYAITPEGNSYPVPA